MGYIEIVILMWGNTIKYRIHSQTFWNFENFENEKQMKRIQAKVINYDYDNIELFEV
jgi:hypothetical protein